MTLVALEAFVSCTIDSKNHLLGGIVGYESPLLLLAKKIISRTFYL